MEKDNQAVCAMVTFRSMEGSQRALTEFKFYLLTKCFYTVCKCCTPKSIKKKLFRGKWLRVRPAVDPELLLWENFGLTSMRRCLRTTLYLIYMIILLLCSFYMIMNLEHFCSEKEE